MLSLREIEIAGRPAVKGARNLLAGVILNVMAMAMARAILKCITDTVSRVPGVHH
jgi:hypothetical protein